jgi:acylphosphatase
VNDSESGLQQRAFRVRGRVQGVGFRWWTQRKALGLGLQGTVGNCVDGTVEIHVAGDAEALDRFYNALQSGPVMARVDKVEDLRSVEDLPTGFEIV